MPLTVRPSFTSKQGITLTFSMPSNRSGPKKRQWAGVNDQKLLPALARLGRAAQFVQPLACRRAGSLRRRGWIEEAPLGDLRALHRRHIIGAEPVEQDVVGLVFPETGIGVEQ